MKKMILVLFVFSILVFSGCSTTTVQDGDTKVTTTTDGKKVTQTVQTEDGEQETQITATEGKDSWCPEGGNWNMQSTGQDGDATASWKVDKLITSGEYKGYCHVVYTAQGPDGEMKMDYYFDESGENGYYEMEVNGQKIKQEWHEE